MNNNTKSKLSDLKKQLEQESVSNFNGTDFDVPNTGIDNVIQPNTVEDNKLTDKQLMFVEEYLKDGNGRQAAIRAGYSEKTAIEQSSRLLTKVHIQSYLQKRRKEIMIENGVTISFVIEKLFEILDRAENDIEGPNNELMLKTLQEINKMFGFYNYNPANINIQNNNYNNEIKIVIVKPNQNIDI